MESVRKTYKAVCLGILCLCIAALHGCINDDYAPQDDPASPAGHPTYLVLHIQPLNPLATRAGDIKTTEAVRSLRVVMTDESGKVELNELIDAKGLSVGADGQPATTDDKGLTDAFSSGDRCVIYKRQINPGKKHFYLFANEESVGELSFSSSSNTSGNTNDNSLTDFLNSAEPNTPDFKTKIESAYFSPDYKTEGNTIYLPYSTYYELDIQQGVENQKTMYLVPVATKFEFRFKNTMADNVTIDKITINSIAKNNYLLGNVNKSDYNKDFKPYLDSSLPEEKALYWVEWLRRVSEETQRLPNLPGNETLNNEHHGWIKDYDLPSVQHETNGNDTYEHKSEEINPTNFPVQANGTDFTTLDQWYYYPESKMMASDDEQAASEYEQKQVYTVDFEITKEGETEPKPFPKNKLPNLHALFRNTHVIVEVTILGEAEDVELELRIGVCPWDEGTVTIPTFD